LLEIWEIAEYLGVPVSWVYDRTGVCGVDRIPHFKMGKYLRFDPDSEEFQAWLRKKWQN
jgi:hypothetical protein